MKKIIAWPLAWIIYYIAVFWLAGNHFISIKIDKKLFGDWFYRTFFWRPHLKMMNWSLKINNWGGIDLWSKGQNSNKLRR